MREFFLYGCCKQPSTVRRPVALYRVEDVPPSDRLQVLARDLARGFAVRPLAARTALCHELAPAAVGLVSDERKFCGDDFYLVAAELRLRPPALGTRPALRGGQRLVFHPIDNIQNHRAGLYLGFGHALRHRNRCHVP